LDRLASNRQYDTLKVEWGLRALVVHSAGLVEANPGMAEIRDIKSGRGGPSRGSMPRRLAAIVVGDIAGYSRLMELDEEGTHNRVKRIERELIELH
jgi:class 3 adenylate cyclase